MNNRIKLLFILTFSCFISHSQLNAQLTYELKTDLFNTINAEPSLFLEVISDKKTGLEFGVHYYEAAYGVLFLDFSDPMNVISDYQKFDTKSLQLYLSGKFYFFENKKGYGVFGGPYSAAIFDLDVEDGYESAYFQANGRPIETYTWKEWQLGVQAGYKFLIKERIPIELAYSIAWNILFRRVDTVTDGSIYIKVGWRFGK